MNWAYASIIQSLALAVVMNLVWIGIYKLTSRGRNKED